MEIQRQVNVLPAMEERLQQAGGQYARDYPPRPPDNRFCHEMFS